MCDKKDNRRLQRSIQKNTRLHCEPNESNPSTHRAYFRLKPAAAQGTAVKKEHVCGKYPKQPRIKRGFTRIIPKEIEQIPSYSA